MTWLEQFQSARASAVPIVVLKCPDPYSVMSAVKRSEDCSMLSHDLIRGVMGINESGSDAADLVNADENGQSPAMVSGPPAEALARAERFMPDRSILFLHNAQMYVEGLDESRKGVIQAILNCRDPFKLNNRTLVLLCPDMTIPQELAGDVITIEVALPVDPELVGVIQVISKSARIASPPPEVLEKCAQALLGLSPFAAEQVAAMCLRKSKDNPGFDVQEMWRMKIADINRTSGLRAERGGLNSFDNLFGLDSLVEFGNALIAGEEPPAVVVLIDELDKQLAGVAGDSSGTSQDAYGTMLTCMEENQWDGMMLPGFPGGGKTEFAKCLGARSGLFVWLDLGGMKGSLVGQSERMVRAAMGKLKAIGGSRIFFVCTANNLNTIPAPLFRRLTAGTYFVDFPKGKSHEAMWKHYMGINGLADQVLPEHENWTGAEIKQCCKWARRLRQPLVHSARRITPVYRSMGEEVERLRKMASGKFLSAHTPGWYQAPKTVVKTTTARGISAGSN